MGVMLNIEQCWRFKANTSLTENALTSQHMPVEKPSASDQHLVIAFAELAARTGWKASSLRLFCESHAISKADALAMWPHGIRSIAWRLNEYADSKTLANFEAFGPLPLSEVMLKRFAENEWLRSSVGALARSDAMHPINTLARTASTAKIMWRCQNNAAPDSFFGKRVRVCALVVLYSACVLVWLGDKSLSKSGLTRAVRWSALMLGAR
jgi:ubiquinone biosynthesis protein COQ9